jgi:hypothetical protein
MSAVARMIVRMKGRGGVEEVMGEDVDERDHGVAFVCSGKATGLSMNSDLVHDGKLSDELSTTDDPRIDRGQLT